MRKLKERLAKLTILPLGVVFFALTAPVAQAQSVSPVIMEYKGMARGKFELKNVGIAPVNVILEPKSFRITEDGDGVYGPLDRHVHLKLSAMSVRIPGKQSRFVFYEARADQAPAWFVIYSRFGGPVNAAGANLEIDLPHTVYILQKTPLQKKDVEIESAQYSVEHQNVTLRLVNKGNDLGRALGCEASGAKHKSQEAGFPLLPQSHRTVVIDWKQEEPPQTLSVRFANFVLKQDLRVREQ